MISWHHILPQHPQKTINAEKLLSSVSIWLTAIVESVVTTTALRGQLTPIAYVLVCGYVQLLEFN
jgi:uncharacterized membrane-anchored protein